MAAEIEQVTDQTLSEIEDLLRELAELAHAEVTSEQFHNDLLHRTIQSLAARAGAVWLVDLPSGDLRLHCQQQLAKAFDDSGNVHERHLQVLQWALQQNEPKAIPPQSSGAVTNPTDSLLLFAPIVVDERTIGLVEIFQRAETSPAAQSGFLRFLNAISDLAADFQQQDQLRDIRERAETWGQFETFAERVHSDLDLDATAFRVANEGRSLLDCDRLSVGVIRGRRARILAVSGSDMIDRRANSVRRLETLIDQVAKIGEPLWYLDEAHDLPPQIQRPLEAYLDEAKSRLLGVLPLLVDGRGKSPQVIGAVVVERFEAVQAGETFRRQAASVQRQSALAIANAVEHNSVPFLKAAKSVGRLRWQLPTTMLVLAMLIALPSLAVTIQTDFVIEGFGELQPEIQREIFAPSNGIVSDLPAVHSLDVKKGADLIRLTNPDLDVEITRILGEADVVDKRTATINTELLGIRRGTDPNAQIREAQLLGENEELKEKLKSLNRQRDLLYEQRDQLTLKSPIDGRILTWKVAQRLANRPVSRGVSLLKIAKLDGNWLLDIQVADEDIGHVMRAQQSIKKQLDVSFVLATKPSETYRGQVEKIAATTQIGDSGIPSVLVTVRIDPIESKSLRPGAAVIPKIHCGQRSVGYVWFRQLFETVQKRILF